jgi:hypothetical protein
MQQSTEERRHLVNSKEKPFHLIKNKIEDYYFSTVQGTSVSSLPCLGKVLCEDSLATSS